MRNHYRKLLAGIAIVLASLVIFAQLSSPLQAQSFYGTVVGTVTDASGAVIPGVSVILTNTGTNEKHTTDTDSTGNYRFVNLVPANYRLEVEASGFKRLTREGIIVQVGAAVRSDARLEVGAVTETVEVSSTAPLLQTETGTLGQMVEGTLVQEMPLNGRNPMNLIALTPGVVAGSGSTGSAPMNRGTNTGITDFGNIQIGGGLANYAAFYVDGAPANVISSGLGLILVQDAVQEFRVESSSVGAEFGRSAGGVVNMTTKSGANAFHGSAYEYLRNNKFNANNFFSNLTGSPRPQWNQNQYGATSSGPVLKDKLFFFFSWEGFKANLGQPQYTNVPTAAMRAGTFNKRLTFPSAIPSSCYSYPSSTVTQINPTCFDPTAKFMVGYYYPPPNSSDSRGNYFASPPYGNSTNQYNVRIDYNISDKQRLFGRYTYWGMADKPVNLFNNTTSNSWNNNRSQNYVVGDTYAFSPSLVLDARISVLRLYFDANPVSLGVDLSQFGAAYAALAPYVTYVMNPNITFAGSTGVKSINPNAMFTWRDVYDLAANLTKIAGRHTLKFGGDFRMMDNNRYASTNAACGLFAFNTALTGDEFAAFLLGIPTTGTITTVGGVGEYLYYQGYYLTDSWQLGNKLTLNLGLRWELTGAQSERHDNATVFLPDTTDPVTGVRGTLALVNSDLYPDQTMLEVKHNLFAPRVGLAYRLSDQTVLRAGYGINYPPNDTGSVSPSNAPIISATYQWINSPNSITHYLYNPFPEGILQPTGRNDPNFTKKLLGQSFTSQYPYQPAPYYQQWNLSLGHQFAGNMMLEAGYAGAKGTHLVFPEAINLNQLSSQYYSLGAALIANVPGTTTKYGQTLRPFPAYNNVLNGSFGANLNWHSMQAKMQKRFKSAGVLMANYTWAKSLTNTDGAGSGKGRIQDFNNLFEEYSLAYYDVAHRFVASYSLNLPLGKGMKFANWGGVSGKLISGWAVNGIFTLQSGFPLPFTATANNLNNFFGAGTIRPNLDAACVRQVDGRAQDRLGTVVNGVTVGGWFNTKCFSKPGAYSLGSAARTDPQLRSHGINNWDLSLSKTTKITEQVELQFRAEFFNLFNRVQFAAPGTIVDGNNFGVVTAQQNQPRLGQFSLRLNF